MNSSHPLAAVAGIRRRGILRTTLAAAVAGLLAACGGGGGEAAGPAGGSAAPRGLLALDTAPINDGVFDGGLLLLLVPDDFVPADPRVGAWFDAATEVGVRMLAVTDAQFLALGADALRFGGVVLPDDLHAIASDTLVAAVKDYVGSGGKAMLCFDFGALTLNAEGVPVYAIPKSRLSDLAGVDYMLYDQLRERTVGLGPVTAMTSMMRALRVPPGKSMPYGAGAQAAAYYLPVSTSDPGGVRGFDPQQFHSVLAPSVLRRPPAAPWGRSIDYGAAVPGGAAPAATRIKPARKASDILEAISGYIYGYLTYPTYVTQGSYAGEAIAGSDFGLVAGLQSYGQGQVLFVNLPLTYLKGRTDAMPMHGLLAYYAIDVLRLPALSSMPDGVAGMTLNLHLDSLEAQQPTLRLEQLGVFRDGPFSIDMTAGPDAVVPGDGLGWDLDHNPVAQDLLRRLDAGGHSVGSHGGWIHDYYGLNASEDNEADFEPLLLLNRVSVDAVTGHPGREYAPPEGNSPTWAMRWLESRGVVGTYFGGHTGLGVTRQYRDGVLQTPALFVFPVTPQGLYATFEEFQDFGVPKSSVLHWYRDLIDFGIAYDTSRMVYMHPPGADAWYDVLQKVLQYAKSKGRNFRWYTMPTLADFAARRLGVQWTQVDEAGTWRFAATAAQGLGEMVWRLPKSAYQRPVLASAAMGSVSDGGSVWLVKAAPVDALSFTARPA